MLAKVEDHRLPPTPLTFASLLLIHFKDRLIVIAYFICEPGHERQSEVGRQGRSDAA